MTRPDGLIAKINAAFGRVDWDLDAPITLLRKQLKEWLELLAESDHESCTDLGADESSLPWDSSQKRDTDEEHAEAEVKLMKALPKAGAKAKKAALKEHPKPEGKLPKAGPKALKLLRAFPKVKPQKRKTTCIDEPVHWRIRGLTSSEGMSLNGKSCELLQQDAETKRWKVRVMDGSDKHVNVKEENLERIEAECDIGVEIHSEIDRDLSSLGPQELLKLLNGSANAEDVLRGVDQSVQEEMLRLLSSPQEDVASAEGSEIVVPIAAASLCQSSGNTQGDEHQPSPVLRRVGGEGGLGPYDAFCFGVVVGPSGSGVSTLLHKLASELDLPTAPPAHFRSNESVASCFEDAVSLLPRVGLNSIPAWMRPYHVLSNGQQQRVRLAKGLTDGAVVDDFGSGIDEQEIDSIAHAIGKFIRQKRLSRVLIGTHFMGAVRFLQPDFVIFPSGDFCINPNAVNARHTQIVMEPKFLGKLEPEEGNNAVGKPYVHEDRGSHSHSMRVQRHMLEIKVKTDERTLDAANAFELDFDGIARCSIPILPHGELPMEWTIGFVVGPSGTGKTMTIKNFQSGHRDCEYEVRYDADCWPLSNSDAIYRHVEASGCGDQVSKVLEACCVPKDCWSRSPPTLSRSEAWRSQLACQLAIALSKRGASSTEEPKPCFHTVVVDEFTTQLDRKEARALCESLSKYVHSVGVRLLCATVHRDIISWLNPCWVFDTEQGTLSFCNPEEARPDNFSSEDVEYSSPDDIELWRPPKLIFDICSVAQPTVKSLWKDKFKQHHYLTGEFGSCLVDGCFVAIERGSGNVTGFHASMMLPGRITYVREYRLVVLPAWQGFGIGPRLSNFIAERWSLYFQDKGYRYLSKTAHPRLGEIRQHDSCWAPTTSNLKGGDKEFGDVGDFKGTSTDREARREKMAQIWLMPHGTKLKPLSKQKRFVITEVAIADKEVELNISKHKEKLLECGQIECACGIFLTESLVVEELKDPIAKYFSPSQSGVNHWKISKVNGIAVQTLEGLRMELNQSPAVATFTFCAVRTSESKRLGPERSSLEEVMNDITWLRTRCIAQPDLGAEQRHVYKLVEALKKTAKQHKRSSSRTVERPRIPKVSDDKCQPLLDALPQPEQPKPRISYSHSYVGHLKDKANGAYAYNDQHYSYQLWMKVRIPEFRAAGRTHQAAIEAAMAEYRSSSRVCEFNWCDLEIPSLGLGSQYFLGAELDDDARIVGVQEGITALRGFNYGACRQNQVVAKIIAVRRNSCKVDISSMAELSAAFERLCLVEGDTALLYLQYSKVLGRQVRSSVGSRSQKDETDEKCGRSSSENEARADFVDLTETSDSAAVARPQASDDKELDVGCRILESPSDTKACDDTCLVDSKTKQESIEANSESRDSGDTLDLPETYPENLGTDLDFDHTEEDASAEPQDETEVMDDQQNLGTSSPSSLMSLEDALPADAPSGHEAYRKCRVRNDHGRDVVVLNYRKDNGKLGRFQIQVNKCGSEEVAKRIARACYMQLETKNVDIVTTFREECYNKIKPRITSSARPQNAEQHTASQSVVKELRYAGTMKHRAYGNEPIHVRVIIKSDCTGEWTACGQTEQIRIVRNGYQIRMMDSCTELAGVETSPRTLRGNVIQSGKRDGEFELKLEEAAEEYEMVPEEYPWNQEDRDEATPTSGGMSTPDEQTSGIKKERERKRDHEAEHARQKKQKTLLGQASDSAAEQI